MRKRLDRTGIENRYSTVEGKQMKEKQLVGKRYSRRKADGGEAAGLE